MKTETKVLLLSIFMGAALWIGNAALDALFFSKEPFLDVLILDVTLYELYMRTTIFLALFAIGIIAAVLLRRERRAREALVESEEKYRALVETTETGYLILDSRGKVIDANREYVRLSGHEALEQILGRDVAEWTAPYDLERNVAEVKKCAKQGFVRNLQVDYLNQSGQITPIEINATVVGSGDSAKIVSLCRDITERRRAEETIRQLNTGLERRVAERTAQLAAANEELGRWAKTLEARVAERTSEVKAVTEQLWQSAKLATMGELVASIAHELNSPLATITLRVEGLQAALADAPAHAESLAVVSREVDRLAGLIERLTVFSGRRTSHMSTLLVAAEVEGALRLMGSKIERYDIKVILEWEKAMPPLHADHLKFRQVFMNLIANAVEAMPGGGTLTIRGRMDGGEMVLEFQDTGRGIPPEMLEKVVTPFFSTKPEGTGTGLGLPICKRVVEEHGGRLEISSAVGQGTTVRIVLPAERSRSDAIEEALLG